jgi:hypothetical protein
MVAISIKVQTCPGSGTFEDPVSFRIAERTFRVTEIVDRWHGSDLTYYKVIGDDGNLYVIKHDLNTDEWELVQMEVIS